MKHFPINPSTLRINIHRLQSNIEELGSIGRNETNGLDRVTFNEFDLEAREWFKQQLTTLQLPFKVDAAANIWTTLGTNSLLAPITIGSHLDTVPNGGKYDGALGVLIGLEILTTLMEHNIEMTHPISLVSFTAEEPNPFNLSTFGSRVITGKLKNKILKMSKPLLVFHYKEHSLQPEGLLHILKRQMFPHKLLPLFLKCISSKVNDW